MSSMRCPEEFYLNCRNAAIKCSKCKAGTRPSGKLEYNPISESSPSIEDHPTYGRDKKAYENKRKGMANENKIQKRLIKKTAASGALLGNGDLEVSGASLQIEAKHRGTSKRWFLTEDEYRKGQRQGINVYAITKLDESGAEETLYLLNESTFARVIGLLTREENSTDIV